MPEYLAPGVYVEEVSFRAKSIEGVSTSVTAFIGPTRYGPVGGTPELLTSFSDYERIYGGLDELQYHGAADSTPTYMAHAVRAYFDNGGTMLYATRVYNPPAKSDGVATSALNAAPAPAPALRARFPGSGGNNMKIVIAPKTTANLLNGTNGSPQIRGIRHRDVVYIWDRKADAIAEGFYLVIQDPLTSAYTFEPAGGGAAIPLGNLNPFDNEGNPENRVHLVTISVIVQKDGRFEVAQPLGEFSPDPASRNAITDYFSDSPTSRDWYLSVPFAIENYPPSGADLVPLLLGPDVVKALRNDLLYKDYQANPKPVINPAPTPVLAANLAMTYMLTGGDDGLTPTAEDYYGDDSQAIKMGLKTFEDIDEISIVAAPGYSYNYADNPDDVSQIAADLITHCELMRYRVLVLDTPPGLILSEVRSFRAQFDTEYAAMYYPWLRVMDPLDPDGRAELDLPPSGYVTGIYARNDAERSVAKAPANEIPLGAIGLERLLNKSQQDILNPDGIDCFRYFPDRGFRLWGARTLSSDPDWKYINVRRYFVYLEHSIDKGTQFAVFENNNDRLWALMRRTIEDFLYNEWKNGNLMGAKPEQAYFVRCDRSTMTQNDLDNGRLVCLIGVAVNKPAEYVIFRIGQMTADGGN